MSKREWTKESAAKKKQAKKEKNVFIEDGTPVALISRITGKNYTVVARQMILSGCYGEWQRKRDKRYPKHPRFILGHAK